MAGWGRAGAMAGGGTGTAEGATAEGRGATAEGRGPAAEARGAAATAHSPATACQTPPPFQLPQPSCSAGGRSTKTSCTRPAEVQQALVGEMQRWQGSEGATAGKQNRRQGAGHSSHSSQPCNSPGGTQAAPPPFPPSVGKRGSAPSSRQPGRSRCRPRCSGRTRRWAAGRVLAAHRRRCWRSGRPR
jgi:hypothetical protein